MLLASYDCSFIVQAAVITIVNYNHTVIAIVNYDRKTFIVQPTVITIVNYDHKLRWLNFYSTGH
jgi:hypothetical protein